MAPRPSGGSQRALTRPDVDEFELVEGQLRRYHAELIGLAKSKSNDALNEFKLKLLNALIERANHLLGAKYEAIPGFKQFESEQVPSLSDALLVLSQYLGALEKLRADSVELYSGSWWWVIDGQRSGYRAAPPERLQRK